MGEGKVLASDQDFVIVVRAPGDDLATLAQRYLGNAGRAWWIAEFNHIEAVRPGQDVVIPLRAPNPLGVQAAGVQTVPILCYHRFGPQHLGRLQVSAPHSNRRWSTSRGTAIASCPWHSSPRSSKAASRCRRAPW